MSGKLLRFTTAQAFQSRLSACPDSTSTQTGDLCHHMGSAITESHWKHTSASRLLTRLFPLYLLNASTHKGCHEPCQARTSDDRLSHPSSRYSRQICSSESQWPTQLSPCTLAFVALLVNHEPWNMGSQSQKEGSGKKKLSFPCIL